MEDLGDEEGHAAAGEIVAGPEGLAGVGVVDGQRRVLGKGLLDLLDPFRTFALEANRVGQRAARGIVLEGPGV